MKQGALIGLGIAGVFATSAANAIIFSTPGGGGSSSYDVDACYHVFTGCQGGDAGAAECLDGGLDLGYLRLNLKKHSSITTQYEANGHTNRTTYDIEGLGISQWAADGPNGRIYFNMAGVTDGAAVVAKPGPSGQGNDENTGVQWGLDVTQGVARHLLLDANFPPEIVYTFMADVHLNCSSSYKDVAPNYLGCVISANTGYFTGKDLTGVHAYKVDPNDHEIMEYGVCRDFTDTNEVPTGATFGSLDDGSSGAGLGAAFGPQPVD
jgi:hypothetical protein